MAAGEDRTEPKKARARKEQPPTPAADVEKFLAKADEPSALSRRYHPFYAGKVEIVPKCVVRTVDDFSVWYTPGVTEACRMITADPLAVYDLTNKWNNVAIVTDGTRILGLGDIGPEAGLPVMEGKSLLFKFLGGVDAYPLPLATKDPDDVVQAVKWLAPNFGGINLEDIAQPKCFTILERLRREMTIPVWHDDQQGTATVVLAGFLNALKVVGKRIDDVRVTVLGAGASCVVTVRLLTEAGLPPGHIVVLDTHGILHAGRTDLVDRYPEKWHIAKTTNAERRSGDAAEALRGADAVIAASRPGPGVLKPEWIRAMSDDPVVFAIANPVPEIWPWEAKEAGARVVATGRSDFPNQVNNSLGFPGIFRGTLDVRATTITDGMCLAAARALAARAEAQGLSEDRILPTMDDWTAYPLEAAAVAEQAMKEGVARRKHSTEEIYNHAEAIIRRAREQTQALMRQGFIRPPPA